MPRKPFALLFGLGGAFTLAHVAVPDATHTRDGYMALAAGVLFGMAALVWLEGRRLPAWAYQLLLGCAPLVAAFVVWASGESTSIYATFFFWCAAFAFYFFDEGEAAEQTVLIGVGLGLALAADPGSWGSSAVVNWSFATIVLTVAGALMGRVGRDRNSRLAEQLQESTRTDHSTGLLNRRGFQEALRMEFERAQRTNRSFSLLICDLDGFNRINESLGWHAGDLAMEFVGTIFRRNKRRIDLAAHIGEDEFAIMLPEAGEHAAYSVAERLRHDLKTSFASEPIPITISVGVANWPLHQSTMRGLYTAGEQALRLAKELGGDRSAMYGDNMLTRLATASARNDEDKHLATLMSLAEAMDIRDGGTAAHCQNVGRYAAALARELGLPEDVIERVRCGGILHDLGKIGIPDSILGKPGPLTDAEWGEMRKHPELGAHILEGPTLADVRAWVLGHHERPDGKGYPYGLGPDQIPIESRILAVADAFEAMTADRVYRKALPADEAIRRLRAGAGTQWDRGVVDSMIRLVERREMLVATSLWVSQEESPFRDDSLVRDAGQFIGTMPAPAPRTMSVRGRVGGRPVEALWSNGRVSGDPLVVTMVDQMLAGHEMDLRDPWNFLLMMGSAFDQGTLDADGELPVTAEIEQHLAKLG